MEIEIGISHTSEAQRVVEPPFSDISIRFTNFEKDLWINTQLQHTLLS